jgi:hypothetical protein
MADIKIKKYEGGSGWVEAYPETTVGQIITSNSPTTNTFLRGDGAWATPADSTTLTSLGVTSTAAELNVLDGITATTTELNYTDGVTSIIQTQLNAKLGTGAKAADSDLLDGIDSSAFLRSNTDDTLTATLFVDSTQGGSIAYIDSAGTYIPRPSNASYKTSTATVTGALTVRLPGATPSDMMSFWIDVMDYAGNPEGESVSIYVYGYAYTTSSPFWTNVGALILSDRTDRDYNVRFGYDGTNHVVCVGETTSTWSYPQVIVRDFQAGYDALATSFDDGWSITFLTTLPSIGQTASNNYPVAKDSNLLNGYASATATTANTIVRRDANGYIYGIYINSNRGNETSAAASYIYDTGDGWLRKKTLANAQTEIVTSAAVTAHAPSKTGTGASGTWGINVSGSAATLTTARTIALAGDVTGSASFNGGSDISITATIADDSIKEQLKFLYIYGKAQSAITKGQAVQFAGVQGDHILMKPAVPSEINANPDYFIGIAEATLATNDFGYILTQGELVNVDTSAYTAGILWFASAGSTAGALTATEPTGANAKIQVCAVTKVNATEGILIVRVNFVGTEIEDIVATGTPSATTFLRGDGSWNAVTATNVGLGNVTNESKATMFASPALTGIPTAPTASFATNTTQLATTAFVQTALSGLVSSAPATLDTLNELAAALGDDPNFATTVSTSIGTKVTANTAITAGTATKITYDTKGLVTGGTTLAAGDLPTHTHTIANVTGLQTALDGKAASSHTHGNITNAGAIGTTASLPIITTTSGVLTTGSFGTTAGTFTQGNDSRLSDARTPLSHTHGDISNTGAIATTAVSPESNDYIIISDSNNSNVLKRGILINSVIPDGTFLQNNGTFARPRPLRNISNFTAPIASNGTTGVTLNVTETIAIGNEYAIEVSDDATSTNNRMLLFWTQQTSSSTSAAAGQTFTFTARTISTTTTITYKFVVYRSGATSFNIINAYTHTLGTGSTSPIATTTAVRAWRIFRVGG